MALGRTGTAHVAPPTALSLKGSRAVPRSLCRDHGTTAQQNKNGEGRGEAPSGPVTWGRRRPRTCPPNTHSARPEGPEKAGGCTTASGMQDGSRRPAWGSS